MSRSANVQVVGSGSYVPGEPISNERLAGVFGREVVWLSEMLGARTRHFAIDLDRLALRPGETNAAMAARAARGAIDDAHIDPMSIDLIVMATSTPDYPFPATALFVQEQLGLPNCCVIELRAGCGGMAQAFMIATHSILAGDARTALLIGSELISPLVSLFQKEGGRVDKDFLVSAAMFGDGAGALILSRGRDGGGVLDCMSRSISTGRAPGLLLRSGGALCPAASPSDGDRRILHHDYHAIMKDGPELIRLATDWLRADKGYDFADVDYFIPPQIGSRLVDAVAAQLDVPAHKVVSDFARVGNTVSASIYIALDRMSRAGHLKPGDVIVLLPTEATKWIYGAVVVRWTMGPR